MRGRDTALTLYLKPKEGFIPVDTFQLALSRFVKLLPPTDGQGQRINWVVTNLEIGSALLEVQPEVEYHQATHLVGSVFDRLLALETDPSPSQEELTRGFIHAARQFSQVAKQFDLETRVSAGQDEVYITERTLDRADDLLKDGGWFELGSIDGDLERVNTHGSLQASIWPLLDGTRPVRCHFKRDLLPQIKEALDRRVIVYGSIKYSADGEQQWIDVQEIELMPLEDELPSIEEVAGVGADLYGPLSSEDYVRELRRDD